MKKKEAALYSELALPAEKASKETIQQRHTRQLNLINQLQAMLHSPFIPEGFKQGVLNRNPNILSS